MAAFFGNLRNVVIASFVLAFLLIGVYCATQGFDAAAFELFTLRWLHIACGVMWIGLLWYFNFVQIPTMPKIPAELKPAVGGYIAPAALFWFRWARHGHHLVRHRAGAAQPLSAGGLYAGPQRRRWPAGRWCPNIWPSASACGWAPSCGSTSGS